MRQEVEFQNAVEPWEQGWLPDFTNLSAFYPAGYGNGLSGVGCIGCTGDCGSCGVGAPKVPTQKILRPKPRKPPGNVPYTPPPLQPGASYIWAPGMTLGGLTPEAVNGGYRSRGMAGMGFAPGPGLGEDESFPWWLLVVAGVVLLSGKKGRK